MKKSILVGYRVGFPDHGLFAFATKLYTYTVPLNHSLNESDPRSLHTVAEILPDSFGELPAETLHRTLRTGRSHAQTVHM